MSVTIGDRSMKVTLGPLSVEVPFAMDGTTLVVSLDDVTEWTHPPGEEIAIEHLGRIAEAIEAACDASSLDVAFE